MKRLSVLSLVFFLLLVSGVWLTRSVEARTLPENGDLIRVSATSETVITLGNPIAVSGSGVVVTGTTATITAGGSYRATGTLADGMIDIDTTEAVTLTLDGVTLTHTTGSAICVTNAEKLLLVLASGTSNTLTDGATYNSDTDMKSTLFSNDTLEISGDGALTLTGNYKHGIASDDDLIISGGDITIVSAVKDGFHANDFITVAGGTIDIEAVGSDGFESEGDFAVTGGTLAVVATGDGIKSSNAITITDGQIYIDATGDAMESGGTLVISGGVIVALGDGSGLVCGDGYEVTLNGGTVVATGSANSTPSGSSTQHVAVLGSQSVGTALHIKRDDATDVLTFEVRKAYQSMLFTSSGLLGSRTYTVYKGGSISGGTDFHGLYTGATYSGGTTVATFTTDSVVTYVTDLVAIYLPLVMLGEGDDTTSDETLITLGNPITVDGSGVDVSGTTATITAGGSYRATGTLAGGMIEVDTTEAVTLTLDGVTLTNTSGPAISVTSAEKLLLVLAEGTSNTLIDGATYSDTNLKSTLFSNDTLEISGDGALAITGKYKHGIASDDDLIISGGSITIVSAVTDGFHANDNITVSGGTIDIDVVGSDGFESEGTFVVTGGTLTLTVADDGLIGADTVTISGGTIEITSGVEGIESKNAIIINDGTITIVVSDDGLNATNDITINGGQIYINATADAVDSNGTLNFNGGVTVALGGNTPEGGLDCDQCSIALNGGTVVATGGANSTPSNSSSQRVAVLGTRPTGTVIHIERSDGTDVLTFGVSKAYQSMIFTSSTLLANKSHTVYTGGSVSGGTNFHGLYTGATYSGGSTWATFTTNSVVTTVGGGSPPGP